MDQSPVTFFFYALAAEFVAVAFMSIFDSKRRSRGVACLVAAFLTILVGFYWPTWRAAFGPKFESSVEAVASDFRVWFALILLTLLYGMGSNLLDIYKRRNLDSVVEKDIPDIKAVLDALVSPRRLKPQQIGSIANHLLRFQSGAAIMQIPDDNKEVEEYAFDIQTALQRGGWSIDLRKVEQAEEGLKIELKESHSDSLLPDSPERPKAEQLLQQAFAQAGIEVSSSRTSGQESRVFITVGHRPRTLAYFR